MLYASRTAAQPEEAIVVVIIQFVYIAIFVRGGDVSCGVVKGTRVTVHIAFARRLLKPRLASANSNRAVGGTPLYSIEESTTSSSLHVIKHTEVEMKA